MRNSYYVCLGQGKPPVVWDPFDRSRQINLHTDYFGRAMIALEQELVEGTYQVYLTWDLDELPAYGDRVVAVVLGDEWCRVPAYANRVRQVFKCYGFGPELGYNFFSRPTYQRVLTLFQFVQAWIPYLPGRLRSMSGSGGRPLAERILPIPLGYANQIELPIKPLSERQFDLSFAGSVVHKPYPVWSPKRWFQTPKSNARRAMLGALRRLVTARPEWAIDLKITESYKAIRSADPNEYSTRMMDTRICLAPRGTSIETFRFFEGMRYGCIVLTERQPSRWFYDGSPAVIVDDWSRLEDVLEGLLGDPARMASLHEASLRWWRDVCSPEALGHYMATRLQGLASPAK
ncbi:MAG: glycosyltransferase [Rhodothermales bacterium]|nr:glycosyltransferase [Rhodothermales bacterium]